MITVLGPLCNLTGYTSAPLSSYCSMFTCQNGLIFSDVKRITSTIDKRNEYQGIFVDKNILYILRIVCVAKKKKRPREHNYCRQHNNFIFRLLTFERITVRYLHNHRLSKWKKMGAEITVFADHDGLDAKLGATLPLEDKRTLPSH